LWIKSNLSHIISKIKKEWLDHFLVTPLLNVCSKNKKFFISKNNYRSTFAWLFGDFGFHPMCHNVYFHSNQYTEWYLHNFKVELWSIAFLHLKLLKSTSWLHNYHDNGHEYLKKYYHADEFLPLEKKYINLLHYYNILWE
jgi:hypothetical protein